MQSRDTATLREKHSPQTTRSRSRICEPFRGNELLLGITEEAYQQIEKQIEILNFEPQEIIFNENDPGDALYLIAQGSVKISKSGRGGQQETLTYLMERDFFGEMALIDSGTRSAQAAAVSHTILGQIDRATWDLILHQAPHEVLTNFTRAITKRLRQNNQRFIEEMMRNERLSLLGTTISSIMHDMNNPIACIRGACEVIQGTIQNELTDRMGKLIRDAVEKMQVMAQELVDFSRGKTQLNLQFIDTHDLLRDLEPDFAKCGQDTDVQVEMTYDGALHVDRHRLLRVFANLIRNAREAMNGPGTHALRFVVRQVESNVRFELSDTGCGIAGDLLPHIFEPFVTHGKSNGTGLGLAVSKAVVEAHQGTISVRSNNGGTTFRIDLPLRL